MVIRTAILILHQILFLMALYQNVLKGDQLKTKKINLYQRKTTLD